MNYYLYVLLVNQISSFIMAWLAAYFSAIVLFRKTTVEKSRNFSLAMVIYFVYVFLFSIASIIYYGYIFIFYRGETIIYDGRILFVLGIGPYVTINLNCWIEFFLCLDRCFYVLFPFHYDRRKQGLFILLILATIVVLMILYANKLIFLFPTTSQTLCRFFWCNPSPNPYTIYLKISSIVINLCATLILTFLLKYYMKTNSQSTKRMTRMVAIMVTCTALIELVPFIIGQVFSMVAEYSLATVIGPYGFTVSTINIALSTGMYYRAFKRNFGSTNQSNVTIKPVGESARRG